ncbi:MAG: lysophospholipid acyltransferase family protein [Tannerellaceae bacterium]|nr:lysophospholipid acyltransferase family protein [Tannerellaceae bacterium]
MEWPECLPVFSGFKLDRAFQDIRIIGPETVPEGSLLVLANHFCWWDGFIQYRLNEQHYHRLFHVMMLEHELLKHPVLNKAGAYSIRPQSRDILASLHYTAQVLADPANMVLLFPQGRIESMHVNHIHFEKGILYLLKQLPSGTRIVCNVNLVDYHAGRKPVLYIFHHLISSPERSGKETIEKLYNDFYQQCKTHLQKIWI